LVLAQQIDRILIAENDELPGIFDSVKAAAIDFIKKALAANQAFDICDLTANDATFSDGFGAKQLDHPAIRGNGHGQSRHARSVQRSD
jgi:hypothetical protein